MSDEVAKIPNAEARTAKRDVKPAHRSTFAAFVNAIDQPFFALLILGCFIFVEVAGREASQTLIMLVGAVVAYFFRPKDKPAGQPQPPKA